MSHVHIIKGLINYFGMQWNFKYQRIMQDSTALLENEFKFN